MDVHVDRARLARVVVAPDVLEQLVAGEHLARVAEQEGQQLERLRLDRQRLAVAQQPMTAEVDLDVAEFHVAVGASVAAACSARRKRPGSGPRARAG